VGQESGSEALPDSGPKLLGPSPLHMRFVHLYLIGYFILVIGAGLALWQAGLLHRISAIWVFISALVVIGLGIVLAVTSVKPTTISRE
jgi:hypothetical protein